MTKKKIMGSSSKWWTYGMKIQRRLLIIGIITLCIFTAQASSLPMVIYPLKPSPDTGPYQDTEFLEIANETIYGLSNQTMPTGTALLDLQTTQQKLAKMSVSQELYPTAKQINAYLYYTAKAGNEYADAMSFYNKPYSPLYKDESQISEARQYQDASQVIWNQIQNMYPGVTPYRLETSPKPFSVYEDPDFKWPYESSSSKGTLW